MTDFKNAQGRKDTYLDISRKKLFSRNAHVFYMGKPEVDQCIFFKKGQVSKSKHFAS